MAAHYLYHRCIGSFGPAICTIKIRCRAIVTIYAGKCYLERMPLHEDASTSIAMLSSAVSPCY